MDNLLRELIEVATVRTEEGRLKWRAFDEETFRTPIGSGYLHIQRDWTRMENGDGKSHPAVTYSIKASDEQGRIVTEIEATEGFGEGEYPLFDRLFAAARKSALQSDRVITDMLNVLRAGN